MGAFRILFERYQPIIFRQILIQIRDADLAHDIVQETFIRVWGHRSALKPRLSFLAYALRISGNLVRDAIRRRKTRERLSGDLPPPVPSEGDDPAEALQLVLLREKLTSVVDRQLPRRCRAIFLLSRIEGKTNNEIADSLGISVKTVENQLHYALKVLRRSLEALTKSP